MVLSWSPCGRDTRGDAKMIEETLQEALGGGEGAALLLEGWAASQASLPATGHLFFLEPSFVAAAGEQAGLTPALREALAAAARQIAAQPATRALAWHAYYRLRHDPVAEDWPGRRWPLPTALLGDHAGLLYALALLGGLPALRALYQAHGVP